MADRYWVGGTGQWDGTAGTKWSTTAGGAGGASVPTSADNVFFTSATSYTVTISGARACLGFTVSAGNVTFAGTATPSLTVSAGMSMVAATVWGMTGTVTFNATTAQTISINGVNMASPVVFNGVGGTWTLGSAARFRQFTLTNGTFSTSASNYALTVYTFTISATGTKTLSFNGSTVTVVGTGFTSATVFDNLATSGFTFNAGTSNFVCGAEVTGATYFVSTTTQNITFYNFTLTTLFLRGLTFTVGGTNQNSAVFTFNNLTVTGNFSTANRVVTIPANGSYKANMKINGTLTLSGGISAFQRVILTVPLSDTSLQSTASSTAQITAVATSLTDVDFYGIHNDDFNQGVTPAAWTGTRLGDASNNTNITFPAAKTVYYVAATAGNWSSANWSTTSGGATASTNYPLPQDTAIINNSSGTGTLTLNYGQVYYGTINCSTRSTALTISLSSNRLLSVNNITLSSSITMSGANSLVFMGTRACTITASGATISCPFTIDRPINGNSITLGSAVTTTSNITMRTGDINLSSFTLTCGSTFSIDPQNTTFETSIIAGTGNITLSGTGTVFTAAAAATTEHLITGVPIFNVTNNTATATTVTADNLTATNSMIFNFTAGTYALTLTGNFNSVNFTGFAGTLNNSLRSFYGSFTASTGMTLTAGTNAQTFAATAGTNTITSNGKTFDFPVTFNGVGGTWQLSGALTVGSTRTVTLTNGTLNLNNQTLTTGSVLAAGGTTIAFGTGNITIIGTGTVWQDYNVISTGSQVVNVNNNTATATTVSPGAASEANA